jgi:hypothetical protein
MSNILEVAWPTFLIGLYFAIIGLGVQAAVAGLIRFPASIGTSMAIGLAVTSTPMVCSYIAFEDALLPVWPITAICCAALIVGLFNPARLREARSVKAALIRYNPVSGGDVLAGVLTLLVMLPVLKYGLTYWTTGTNDFPNYAASAQIWADSRQVFSAKHADAFGAMQLSRAEFAKPSVTALLVLASKISGTPPYQLLSPMTFIFLFVLFSSLISALHRLFGLGSLMATVSVAIPNFSIVPLSRVYDAQIGQVASVAFFACLLAVLGTIPIGRNRWSLLVLALISAALGVACIGSDFTLIAGSSLLLGGTLLWVMFSSADNGYRRFETAMLCAVASALLCIPMLGTFVESASVEMTGAKGFDIPLASPLSLIGLQPALNYNIDLFYIGCFWILFFAIFMAALVSSNVSQKEKHWTVVLLLCAVANGSLVGLKLGWDNYGTHKWFAVLIAVTIPFLAAYIVSRAPVKYRFRLVAIMALLSALSVLIGVQRGTKMYRVIPKDLISLGESRLLANLSNTNILLGDTYYDSIAALIVPARSVTVVERTYAEPSPPGPGPFVIPANPAGTKTGEKDARLNETYALSYNPWALDRGAILHFGELGSRRFLSGEWNATEPWGVWSGGGDNHIGFNVDWKAHRDGITVVLSGRAYVKDNMQQKIDFLVDGKTASSRVFRSGQTETIEIPVTADAMEKSSGHIVIDVRVSNPLSPADFGAKDKRKLGFGLEKLKVR